MAPAALEPPDETQNCFQHQGAVPTLLDDPLILPAMRPIDDPLAHARRELELRRAELAALDPVKDRAPWMHARDYVHSLEASIADAEAATAAVTPTPPAGH